MNKELEAKINDIFTRGVGEFIDPDGILKRKLIEKAEGKYDKDIIIKYGVDPTRPDIHLGHAVCFRKLRQFQDLGCKIVFLVGDFTAQIGDPTGKDKTRPELNLAELLSNVESFITQIDSLINTKDKKCYEWLANSIWYQSVTDLPGKNMIEKTNLWEAERKRIVHYRGQLPTVTLFNLMSQLRKITHAKLIDRNMFQERIKKGAHLFMHEMLYPVLQGIDSEIIAGFFGSCDLELGGTDQTFNMLVGRDIMKNATPTNLEPQAVVSMKLLEGIDGKEKMSKSLDNYIGITEKPNDMFGKIMSIPDSSMINYYELCTELPLVKVKDQIESNPRDAKIKLATEIVKIYHGEGDAEKAKKYFIDTFSKKEIPELVPEWVIAYDAHQNVIDFMVSTKLATSRGDARRKIEQGGVSIDGEKVPVGELILSPELHGGKVMKVGKFHFVRIKFKKA